MTTATWDEGYAVEPQRAAARKSRLAMPVLLLVIAFVMPPETSVSLGSLRLSPYRVILLILVVPKPLHILSGKAGPLNGVDLAILLHSIWCVIALGAYGGGEQALEMRRHLLRRVLRRLCHGPPLHPQCRGLPGAVARHRARRVRACSPSRCRSRSPTCTSCARPSAALLGGPALPFIEPRMGLARAFGSFEHPILFGVFCSMAFATAWFVAQAQAVSPLRGWLLVGCIILASFVSLSAGAWMMLGVQIALAGVGQHDQGPAGPLGGAGRRLRRHARGGEHAVQPLAREGVHQLRVVLGAEFLQPHPDLGIRHGRSRPSSAASASASANGSAHPG